MLPCSFVGITTTIPRIPLLFILSFQEKDQNQKQSQIESFGSFFFFSSFWRKVQCSISCVLGPENGAVVAKTQMGFSRNVANPDL